MKPITEIVWSQKAQRHIWARHRVTIEEVLQAIEDPRHDFRRWRGNRYRLIGMARDRLLTLFLEDTGDPRLSLVTSRPANSSEKRLYRQGKR